MTHNQVMVVDDDEDIRDTLKLVLEFGGMRVVTAENGLQCIEELRNGFKGLILLDVMMPKMDGWEVVRTMTETGLSEGNIVCMISALEPSPLLAEYSSLVRDYIRKPFDANELLAIVNKHLASL